jgi:hypothetical protein
VVEGAQQVDALEARFNERNHTLLAQEDHQGFEAAEKKEESEN